MTSVIHSTKCEFADDFIDKYSGSLRWTDYRIVSNWMGILSKSTIHGYFRWNNSQSKREFHDYYYFIIWPLSNQLKSGQHQNDFTSPCCRWQKPKAHERTKTVRNIHSFVMNLFRLVSGTRAFVSKIKWKFRVPFVWLIKSEKMLSRLCYFGFRICTWDEVETYFLYRIMCNVIGQHYQRLSIRTGFSGQSQTVEREEGERFQRIPINLFWHSSIFVKLFPLYFVGRKISIFPHPHQLAAN